MLHVAISSQMTCDVAGHISYSRQALQSKISESNSSKNLRKNASRKNLTSRSDGEAKRGKQEWLAEMM